MGEDMTNKTTLDIDHLPLLTALQEVLMHEPDPVRQQQAIELLMVSHAQRAGNSADGCFIIDAMAKHAKQIVTQNVHMILDGSHKR